MTELFGPEYVRPVQVDCPECVCCTANLCVRGKASVLRCAGHTPDGLKSAVADCPCSGEGTPRTAAWRAAQVRATRLAVKLPVSDDAEVLPRALAAGDLVAVDDVELLPQLKLRGLAEVPPGGKAHITALGRTYLAGRDDARAPASVRVVDVDVAARTARVEVGPWHGDEPVTVLLDQVVTDTGYTAKALPGMWLTADVNCYAAGVDQLFLTRFRNVEALSVLADGEES